MAAAAPPSPLPHTHNPRTILAFQSGSPTLFLQAESAPCLGQVLLSNQHKRHRSVTLQTTFTATTVWSLSTCPAHHVNNKWDGDRGGGEACRVRSTRLGVFTRTCATADTFVATGMLNLQKRSVTEPCPPLALLPVHQTHFNACSSGNCYNTCQPLRQSRTNKPHASVTTKLQKPSDTQIPHGWPPLSWHC